MISKHKPFLYVTAALLAGLLASCSCNRYQDLGLDDDDISTHQADDADIVDPVMERSVTPATHLPQTTAEDASTTKTEKKEKKKSQDKPPAAPEIDYENFGNESEKEIYDFGLGYQMEYQILREAPANADTPHRGQIVSTHYICWHNNNGKPGKLVDSTYERDEPFDFQIGNGYVIRGWDEGLMDMKVGEKRRLFIPSEMAFGQAGATDLVPGGTDLIYEIELVDIRDAPEGFKHIYDPAEQSLHGKV